VQSRKATFGPVLRAARERKGITLRQLASETKVSAELWADLEDNNLSRWPRQVFARSYVRDYAIRVGLDPDEVVNEFCRLFPEWGDRRAERGMRGHADIVSHKLEWEDLPQSEQRRASDRAAAAAPGFFGRHHLGVLAVLFDLLVVLCLTRLTVLFGAAYWTALALNTIAYNAVGTVFAGRSVGLITCDWILRTVRSIPAARRLVSRVQGV